MPEEASLNGGGAASAPVATPGPSGGEEDLLRLSVKELKNRISQAGGLVPAGHLEKKDLVSALQETLRNGGHNRAGAEAKASSATPGAAASQALPSVASPVSQQGAGATNDEEADLAKLSVGEIKRRLRWAGAAVPAGHLEKAELVSALRAALDTKAGSERFRAQQEKEKANATPKSSSTTMPRPAVNKPTPTPKDTAAIKEQQDTTKWFVMPEEDLKCLIMDAGGKVPSGNVGRHYLVAVLKKALKAKESAASKPADAAPAARPCSEPVMQADKVIEEVAAAPADAAPDPAEAAPPAAQPQPPPEPREWDPDEDVSKLSAGELKRRLREYDEALLKGLAEKSELVAALQKANQAGPPPVRAPVNGTTTTAPTAAVSAPATVELDDAAMQAQMEEMQNLLAAAEADVAGSPLEAAMPPSVAAPVAESASQVNARPTAAGGSGATPPTIEVVEEKQSNSKANARPKPVGSSGGMEVVQEKQRTSKLKAPATAAAAAPARAGRAGKRQREVTISDDEEKPRARRVRAAAKLSTAAVAIDDDDECVQAVDAASPAATPQQSAPDPQPSSAAPEDDGTWI